MKKIKSGFIVRQIAGQYMAVPVGSRTQEIHGMVALNETGAFLWKLLQKEQTEDALVSALLEAYEVDEFTAQAAVQDFLDMLEKKDLLDLK